MNQALGIIETKGHITAIVAADASLKAAHVSYAGETRSGSGLVCIRFHGDVAAVKAAVEAGAEAGARVGEVVSAHVIARPHEDLSKITG